MKYQCRSNARCRICGRRNTFLIRWSGEWASAWSCWRPWHVKRVWRALEASDDSLVQAMRRVNGL